MKGFVKPLYRFLIFLILYLMTSILSYNGWEQKYEKKVLAQMEANFTDVNVVEYGFDDINPASFVESYAGGNLRIKAATFKPDRVGKIYLDYEIKLRQYSKEFTHVVVITDTQAPIIELEKTKITLDYGTSYDPAKNVKKAYDIVDGDLIYSKTCEDKCYGVKHELNVKKAGTYKINVFAIDKNGLQSEQTFEVVVKEKPKNYYPVLGTDLKKYQHTLNLNNVKIGNNLYDSLYKAVKAAEGDGIFTYSKSYVGKYSAFGFWWRDIEQLTGMDINVGYDDLNDSRTKVKIYLGVDGSRQIKNAYSKVLSENEKLKETIRQIWSGIDLNNDDATLVMHLDKWMRKNFSYKLTGGTIYSFLSTKKGQCYHYAHFFKSALDAIGIPCQYIEGYAQGGYHSWNKVKIDGYWYIVDTTFSDLRSSNAYILKTPNQLKGYKEGWLP